MLRLPRASWRCAGHTVPVSLVAGIRFQARSTSSKAALPPPYRILFCGTDDYAFSVLERLLQFKHLHEAIHVLVPPAPARVSRAKRRVEEAPVKQLAESHNLPVHTVPAEGIAAFEPPQELVASNSLLLTASFGHLLPPSLLAHFPARQQLNLHPSLLPRLRGAGPIQWAIARRHKVTGVSVQEVGEHFDTGRILAQTEHPIPAGATFSSLSKELAVLGSDLLVEVLGSLPKYSEQAWAQSDAPVHLKSSNAPKLRRDHSEIAWTWSAEQVEARHRGLAYLHPLRSDLPPVPYSNGSAVQVMFHSVSLPTSISELDATCIDAVAPEHVAYGTAIYSKSLESLIIKCAPASPNGGAGYILVDQLQSTGKKAMSAAKWIVGYRDRAQDGLLTFGKHEG